MRLYAIVSIVSIIVRQFVLPNPFECFGEKAAAINIIAEIIIQPIVYLLVGLVYRAGSNPALGSLMFLITYISIVGILWVLGIFSFAWWWILILVVTLVALVIGIRYLSSMIQEKIRRHNNYWP